ncbi:MAG: helix-turn-helix transcriptional regulator [Peptoniphilus sp. oral taxon 375]|nr:DNA-binding helix-turn-helix protein [Peptoniphilus sp. oral taxon 375 str. F0436]MBS4871919.1 helix-turn-helix transcriptional regulator [Peptoniphilus sp. oral taxon 375]
MPLYNCLQEKRKEHKYNQADLGALVGVSRQTISLIERGDYHPSIVVCLRLAQVLDCRVEDLFTYKEDENHDSI